MYKLYEKQRKWDQGSPKKGDGIIVGCDSTQEWLLPWWWDHYSRHNSHPVAWIDFGLSEKMKDWCRERGSLIPLPVADIFVLPREEVSSLHVSAWEKEFGIACWESRNAWFKKPFAFLKTPFERTIWIDTDCEIRGSISELFSFCDHPSGIAMRAEPYRWKQDELIFNSGVVVFRWGVPFIETWADRALEKNGEFMGDQDILSSILHEQSIAIEHLSDIYNRSRRHSEEGATILHWHGLNGKKIIESKIFKARLEKLYTH